MFNKEISIIKSLGPLFTCYPRQLSAVVALGIVETMAEAVGISLFIPFLYNLNETTFSIGDDSTFQRILNNLFVTVPPERRLEIIALCIFVMILIRNCISYVNALLSAAIDARLNHHLRNQVLDQLLGVGIEYIEQHESGKLWNTLENETYNTASALTTMIDLIIAIFTIFLFAVVLMLLSWQFTLIVLIALGVISTIIKLATRRVEELSAKGLIADEKLSQRILETFKGMQTIRLFGCEAFEKQRFADISKKVSDIYFSMEKITSIVQPISELLVAGLLIFVLLTFLKEPGNLPTVLVFIFILYRLHPQVLALDEERTELLSASASISAVWDVLDSSGKPYIRSGGTEFTGLQERIRFDHVSFSYGCNHDPALRDISLVIPRQKLTALVGRSGAGKSTLISLLLRLYNPTSGRIHIDNGPLSELDLASWRRHLALVSQQPYIFNNTVRDNIAYGRLDASEEEIIACARQAAAHDFISKLSSGYETIIGDSGVQLSAGQRQRIALARAFIRSPEILILDEATNAMDSISEAAIQQTIQELRNTMTIVIIAHRLKTIELADNIIVLEDGKIKERGTTSELIDNETLFAELYHLQTSSDA